MRGRRCPGKKGARGRSCDVLDCEGVAPPSRWLCWQEGWGCDSPGGNDRKKMRRLDERGRVSTGAPHFQNSSFPELRDHTAHRLASRASDPSTDRSAHRKADAGSMTPRGPRPGGRIRPRPRPERRPSTTRGRMRPRPQSRMPTSRPALDPAAMPSPGQPAVRAPSAGLLVRLGVPGGDTLVGVAAGRGLDGLVGGVVDALAKVLGGVLSGGGQRGVACCVAEMGRGRSRSGSLREPP